MKNQESYKRKGGRPHVAAKDYHGETISTRLSPSELLIFNAKVARSKKKRSVYLRELIKNGQVYCAPSNLVAQQLVNLNGGLNNLNQLMKQAHVYGLTNVVIQVEELIQWFLNEKRRLKR